MPVDPAPQPAVAVLARPAARWTPRPKGCHRESDRTLAETDPRWKLSPTKIMVAVLLLIGIVVPLLVSTYDQIDPRLFGLPVLLLVPAAWVFIAAGICGLSYCCCKRERESLRRSSRQPQHAWTRPGVMAS